MRISRIVSYARSYQPSLEVVFSCVPYLGTWADLGKAQWGRRAKNDVWWFGRKLREGAKESPRRWQAGAPGRRAWDLMTTADQLRSTGYQLTLENRPEVHYVRLTDNPNCLELPFATASRS
jgi:hypothetical protein